MQRWFLAVLVIAMAYVMWRLNQRGPTGDPYSARVAANIATRDQPT